MLNLGHNSLAGKLDVKPLVSLRALILNNNQVTAVKGMPLHSAKACRPSTLMHFVPCLTVTVRGSPL